MTDQSINCNNNNNNNINVNNNEPVNATLDNTMGLHDDFPFDTVIITFPDAAAAQAADAGPLQALRTTYPSKVRWVATADPYDARVGSGGGTLAALMDHHWWKNNDEKVEERNEEEQVITTNLTGIRGSTSTSTLTSASPTTTTGSTGSILILHAGGAASRCPTQMCLGKAWTSLPTLQQSGNRSSSSSSNSTERVLQTPLQLWLHTCRQLFTNVPCGTLVVIAADTLLQWDHSRSPGDGNTGQIDWTMTLSECVVLGLAVPAALETATNHGVFVMKTNRDRNHFDSTLSAQATGISGTISIEACVAVLQKPSVADMQSMDDPPCCFQRRMGQSSDGGDETSSTATPATAAAAWIDTGVTVFAPAATRSLVRLARTSLAACTASGLVQLYHQEQQASSSHVTGGETDQAAVAAFGARRAVSVDLYTHILHALSLSSNKNDDDAAATTTAAKTRKDAYLARYSHELTTEIATAIWNEISRNTLQILAVPDGTFWHLGTTRELQSFLVDATITTTTAVPAASARSPLVSDESTATSNDPGQKANTTQSMLSSSLFSRHQECRDFGASLGLTRRHYAYTHLLDYSNDSDPGGRSDDQSTPRDRGGIDQSAVLYHCLMKVLPPIRPLLGDSSYIGARSVLEHCHLEGVSCLQIGTDCLVSGLRSPSSSKTGIVIPDHTMVQMVRLQKDQTGVSSSASERDATLVVVVLGVDDNVKQAHRLYGQPMDEFFRQTGMCRDEVWNASDADSPTLWTARLHPIISIANNIDSFASVFSWLSRFAAHADESCGVSLDPSFLTWKSSQRLSLSEIRNRADAPLEFAYRDELLTRLVAHKREFDGDLHTILMDRQRRSVEFQFLVDEYAATVDASRIFADDVLESLHTLDQVVLQCWYQQGRQDISARASTLASELLDGLVCSVCSVTSHNVPLTHIETVEVRACISSIHASLARSHGDLDTAKINSHYSTLVFHRDHAVSVFDIVTIELISKAIREISNALTGSHVLGARSIVDSLRCQKPIYDKWILATAPVRIDLSGGWSDTPPICYEFGSLVTGMAVSIDGRKPLACRCRIVTGREGILVRTESRDGNTGAHISSIESEINTVQDMLDCRDPSADCALLKCVLMHLGLVPESKKDRGFQSMINGFCQSETTVRIEIVATTTLPHGSGLGTSSILAGCILASICKCIGAGSEASYDEDIINSVLNVEQYLTTGGGFQDQVNGIVGGVKVVSARKNEWPMRISCQKLPVALEFQSELNSSLVLVFTGTTRLAKNLLTQVVRRWSRQTPEILATVSALVNGADACRDAILSQDLKAMGCCLSKYWTLKKTMAGPTSGVEPDIVRHVIQELKSRRLIRGASLCGAGGGGFMVLMRDRGVSIADLQQALEVSRTDATSEVTLFTWHECELCNHGLNVRVLEDVKTEVAEFDVSWLDSES